MKYFWQLLNIWLNTGRERNEKFQASETDDPSLFWPKQTWPEAAPFW